MRRIWLDMPKMKIDYFSIENALNSLKLNYKGSLYSFEWQIPTDTQFGILTSTLAFRLAKEYQINPNEAANELVDLFASSADEQIRNLVTVSAKGPYVNLNPTDALLNIFMEKSEDVLLTIPQNNEKLMFEYVGANVAKRLHAGHMRNLNIGEALRRIMARQYPEILTDNHWGDWGVQFGILIWAYKQAVDKAAYETDPMEELQRLYVWGNFQEGEIEDWAQQVRAEFVKLEKGDSENMALWKEFVDVSKKELQPLLSLFNVPEFDLEQGESFYDPHMKELADFCEKNNFWQKDGLARFVDYEQLAEHWHDLDETVKKRIAGLGRCYLISSQGYTSYAFRDVAARFQWARDHKVEKAVTVTDDRQQHNFKQAFAFISFLATQPEFVSSYGKDVSDRLKLSKLVHVYYGRLHLESGEMSTRKGNIVKLTDLVDQVRRKVEESFASRGEREKIQNTELVDKIAVAALKWHDLKTDPATSVTLRIDDIVSFEGDTGVYQLYSVARLKSILREHGGIKPRRGLTYLNESEKGIIKEIYRFPQVVLKAGQEYKPSLVCEHIQQTSRAVNSWYSHYSVKMENDALRQEQMLAFIELLVTYFEGALELLGIESVEEL